MKFDKLSNTVIGLAIEVHRELGPGLLENTYKQCLAYELSKSNIYFLMEVNLPVTYKDIQVSCGYRMDLLIDDTLVLELKCVDNLHPVHGTQLLTYMRLSNKKIGLLINFNTKLLKDGIKRYVL